MIYYISAKFHLPTLHHSGDTGGHFDPPLVSDVTKTMLVVKGLILIILIVITHEATESPKLIDLRTLRTNFHQKSYDQKI